MNAYAQHGVPGGPGGLAGLVRAALEAWSEAREHRRERERLWQATIADAHALAERGRAMSREAVTPSDADTGLAPHRSSRSRRVGCAERIPPLRPDGGMRYAQPTLQRRV